ncbi:TMEM165/GDT1 family protein [Mesosutterella sp. AGMB02718]|uniref:GDT1 family protein n=1 Tax=Mesosutterella faecium TaxID=2925194 RepID=A0ABT7IJD4_9BURK|nr:TMEM165/GDT1 family protein [Mesosutterella sp. AGMB02718]MDL2058477.1 TMEM165/GDT1 family protein [Mesosutterella sp. AGMB02718]
MLETILLSTCAIALSEIGDKTQLLAFALAARFRNPLPIVLGIFASTLLNHGLAASLGYWINTWLTPGLLRWVLVVSFIAMGLWMLIPDRDDGSAEKSPYAKYGAFAATAILFFLAEMGDKTQIATVALAAKLGTVIPVMMGTTIGMLLADVPVVFVGDRFAKYIPMKLLHAAAALVFIGFGIAAWLTDPASFIQSLPEASRAAAP